MAEFHQTDGQKEDEVAGESWQPSGGLPLGAAAQATVSGLSKADAKAEHKMRGCVPCRSTYFVCFERANANVPPLTWVVHLGAMCPCRVV